MKRDKLKYEVYSHYYPYRGRSALPVVRSSGVRKVFVYRNSKASLTSVQAALVVKRLP